MTGKVAHVIVVPDCCDGRDHVYSSNNQIFYKPPDDSHP